MHILQPEHIKLKDEEAQKLLKEMNISKAQLPKILLSDACLPENSKVGDIIQIKRKEEDEVFFYYRVVV